MIEIPVFDKNGAKLESISIDEKLFGEKVNKRLLRDMIIQYEANKRVGTHQTKTRKEVQGASRKLWKQKHTGRARIGTIRSPIWRHGGTIFGPHPRDYSSKLPVKMRRLALDSALLSKFMDNETIVVTDLAFVAPKTKHMATLLKKLKITQTCLVGLKEHDPIVVRTARNIAKIVLAPVGDFNALDVLKYKKLLLTKDAIEALIKARTE